MHDVCAPPPSPSPFTQPAMSGTSLPRPSRSRSRLLPVRVQFLLATVARWKGSGPGFFFFCKAPGARLDCNRRYINTDEPNWISNWNCAYRWQLAVKSVLTKKSAAGASGAFVDIVHPALLPLEVSSYSLFETRSKNKQRR